MKSYLVLFISFLCVPGCVNQNANNTLQSDPVTVFYAISDSVTIKETTTDTTDIKLANSPEESEAHNEPINCGFYYDMRVEGYAVTGTFTPYYSECETGQIEMHFDNGQKSFTWKSNLNEAYTSSSICDIYFRQSFKGWKNDSTYKFHYYPPEKEEGFDELHPLGYKTPFQFIDIDFDGEKELMISDWSRIKGGNFYHVYRISDGKACLINYAPFTEIQTETGIDAKSKSIEIFFFDGYENSSKFIFAKNTSGIKDIVFPKFPGSCGETIYNNFSKTWKSSGFVLKEFEVQVNGHMEEYVLDKKGMYVIHEN